MARILALLVTFPAARVLRAVCILSAACGVITAGYAAGTTSPENNFSKPASSKPSATPTSSAGAGSKSSTTPAKPLWSDLTLAQRQALAPLLGDWNQLDAMRKNKWLALANKFPAMKPDEQQRVQERMREWAKLTPEQRRVARESYARTKKLDHEQKTAHWEQYQQLPDEQKKKLASAAESKKKVANLPRAAAHKNKTALPNKPEIKPVEGRSVAPPVTAVGSVPQPSPPPPATK